MVNAANVTGSWIASAWERYSGGMTSVGSTHYSLPLVGRVREGA